MCIMLRCVATRLIVEHKVKLEQNWGTNSEEDQRLLGSLSPRASLFLFKVRTLLTNKHGLDSICVGASQILPTTNPQSCRGVSIFTV